MSFMLYFSNIFYLLCLWKMNDIGVIRHITVAFWSIPTSTIFIIHEWYKPTIIIIEGSKEV